MNVLHDSMRRGFLSVARSNRREHTRSKPALGDIPVVRGMLVPVTSYAFLLNPLPDDKILALQTTNEMLSEHYIYLPQSRKYCGKRRKCWLIVFSPFSRYFQKACSFGASKVVHVW